MVNLNNGARLETYVIKGEKGAGMICLNGPAARLGAVGDVIHFISYASISEEELEDYKSLVIILNDNNEIILK